ncbi:MAG: methyltransferase domain-containing protein [Gemmatales bacterium]
MEDRLVVRPPLTPPCEGGEPASNRLQHEQAFHDAQAAERRQGWEHDPARLRFAPEEYLDHEPWVRPAIARLGPISGKRVLDFGCGHGMAATCLAQMGAQVVAFDLSAGYVHEAVARAKANDVNILGLLADGARLPFADASMDAIWGVAILHHLNIAQAAQEIRRILRPDGVAVFCEPWGGNPLLRWARRRLPYPGKERTPDEVPLQQTDLEVVKSVFPDAITEHVQLLGMIRRAWRRFPLLKTLDRWDRSLLGRWPSIGLLCRYVIVEMKR